MAGKSSSSTGYAILVTLVSFSLAIFFFWLSDLLAAHLRSITFSLLFLLIIILFGILADIMGVAVTAASEAPLHAKAAKKIPGATAGVYLIRHADRVANIMNDVVGDIAGTVSGALGIALVVQIIQLWPAARPSLLNMFMTAVIAALTVGGKAMGKRIAIEKADEVVFTVGRAIDRLERLTGLNLTGGKKNGRSAR
ncbi:MAG: hypothetical protein ACOY81_09275 [Bacillota bacterium]|uniref:hypothetical protein n=1 Tax=Desulfurispora thermophila TaxID=265470 RepID=UPI00036E576A|nr:hypothetical protein [Desulfurispora thermophila]